MVIFNSYVHLPESIANGKDDIPYIKWKITFMFETTIQFGKKKHWSHGTIHEVWHPPQGERTYCGGTRRLLLNGEELRAQKT